MSTMKSQRLLVIRDYTKFSKFKRSTVFNKITVERLIFDRTVPFIKGTVPYFNDPFRLFLWTSKT